MPRQSPEHPLVLMVAGEASADVYAARLITELTARLPGLEVTGIGGPAMDAAGAHLVHRMEELAVMGFSEVVPKLGFIFRVLRELKGLMADRRPDLVILLDFPDFNLRLAKSARRLGLKVLYYIGPQVWAWRSSRARAMASLVDRVALILPFEPPVWQRLAPDLPTEFVGHPLLDEFAREEAEPDRPLPVPQEAEVVGLVPGSRHMEIRRMMPLFMASARAVAKTRPGLHFLLPLAPGLKREDLEPFLAEAPANLTVVAGRARAVMRRSKALMITSGTATLEAALAGTPMVVVYKTGWLNYAVARCLVNVSHISLPNLIAGREVVPELIQGAASAERLTELVGGLLDDPARHETMRRDLARVRADLGGPGAGGRVAELALALMEETVS